jgi:hypothetical protein
MPGVRQHIQRHCRYASFVIALFHSHSQQVSSIISSLPYMAKSKK